MRANRTDYTIVRELHSADGECLDSEDMEIYHNEDDAREAALELMHENEDEYTFVEDLALHTVFSIRVERFVHGCISHVDYIEYDEL